MPHPPASPPSLEARIRGGLLGLVVGDALGVPVEFRARQVLTEDPVTSMRGFGTHNQPAGTWSDDSSMALTTAEGLLGDEDAPALMTRFHRWVSEGEWTPHGKVFDIGNATSDAVHRFAAGKPQDEWGGRAERHNGNGSLMRLLPLCLASWWDPVEVAVTRSREVSALTHAHPRSELCCALFTLVVRGVLAGFGLRAAAAAAAAEVAPRVPPEEAGVLGPLLRGEVFDRPEAAVSSGGYVVHTLEAALWCCERYPAYREATLAAVNLGGDTDTTAAVAGGLAGVLYAGAGIPDEWVEVLARRDDVLELVCAFAARFGAAPPAT